MPVSLLPGRRVLVPEGEGGGRGLRRVSPGWGGHAALPRPWAWGGGPGGDFPAPPPCGPQVESGGAWEPLGPCWGGGGQAAGWCVGLRRQLHLSHAPENERPLPPPSGSSGRGGGGGDGGGAERRGQRAEGRGRGQGEGEGPHLGPFFPVCPRRLFPKAALPQPPEGPCKSTGTEV